MQQELKRWAFQGLLGLILWAPSAAQTLLPTPPSQPQATSLSPLSGSLSGPPSSGVTPLPGAATSPLAPSVLPGSSVSSSLGKSFGTAGQGLPGMPGGPPIGSAGSRDPSSGYMRPPVISPLFCDPAINIPCP